MMTNTSASFEHITRCLSVSRRASRCFFYRSVIERETGRCADYEKTARQFVASAPRNSASYRLLADALAVQGAPTEGVQPLLEKAAALRVEVDGEPAAEPRDDNEIALGLLSGDFPRAIAAATDQLRLRMTSTSEERHLEPAMTVITSLLEEGRDGDALQVAENFDKQALGWTLNDDRVRLYLLYARRHAGRISEAAFRQQLDALERVDATRFTGEGLRNWNFWAHAANADGSAIDLDVARPFLDRPLWNGRAEAIRGHLLLLSGRLDDAIAPLTKGAGACETLPAGGPYGWQGLQVFTFMHSHLWLGEALEAKGDAAGACAKYAVVTERWKSAKPRSVTLEKAKARMRALHCGATP